MEDKKTSIWKSDVTKYMAVLWLGYILNASSNSIPSILLMLIEIVGFASAVIVTINFIVGKMRKSPKAL